MESALGKAVRSCTQGDWAAAERELRLAAGGVFEQVDIDDLEEEEEEEAENLDASTNIAQNGDHGCVVVVSVRADRHVYAIEFEFEDGFRKSYGDAKGAEKQEDFVLRVPDREYLVQVKGRQGRYMDGIQFVSNLGRTSRWYGGSGGRAFASIAEPGTMIAGLDLADGACPCFEGLRVQAAPPPPRKMGIFRLLLHPHARSLIFHARDGNRSLFKETRKGYPSVMWLLLRKRALMLRLFLRGKPSLLRLMFDGEQSARPSSLMRTLCTPPPEGGLSAMQLMMSRDPRSRNSHSLAQLLLMGKPSVTRQFMGTKSSPLTPLARMLFEGDQVNGYPSLMYLLTLRDTFDGIEHPSVFEAVLQNEQYQRDATTASARPMSLLRLMTQGKPSLFDLILQGEREGRASILRRMVEDKNNDGLSIARMVMTSFENHKGHRPALSTYIFGTGDGDGQVSILRLMLEAERTQERPSLMRLLFSAMPTRRRRRFRRVRSLKSVKSDRKPAARLDDDPEGVNSDAEDAMDEEEDEDDVADEIDADEEALAAYLKEAAQASQLDPAPSDRAMRRATINRRPLIDLLTAGEPSIADLFFQGELQGEDSLARLMLGTSVDFSSGYLRLGATLKAGNELGVSLMQTILAGEEAAGPGISVMRLLLLGEDESDSTSVLRLLLTKESATDPSILRVLVVALKSILKAAKTRPNHVGEQLSRLTAAIVRAPQGGLPSMNGAFNPVGSQIQTLLTVLRTIRKRGKDFQAMWKHQFLRVAQEIELAGARAPPDSAWHKSAPRWKRIAESIALQRWSRLPAELASSMTSLQSLQSWVSKMQGELRKASAHLTTFDASRAQLVTTESDPDDS